MKAIELLLFLCKCHTQTTAHRKIILTQQKKKYKKENFQKKKIILKAEFFINLFTYFNDVFFCSVKKYVYFPAHCSVSTIAFFILLKMK